MIWLYERDFPSMTILYEEAEKQHKLGLRVFIQGYSTMDCREYKLKV